MIMKLNDAISCSKGRKRHFFVLGGCLYCSITKSDFAAAKKAEDKQLSHQRWVKFKRGKAAQVKSKEKQSANCR